MADWWKEWRMEMSKKIRVRKKQFLYVWKKMFEVCVKRMTVSQVQRGRKKELVKGGIIWALYVQLCPVLSWLAAAAATWISSRGLWGRGSLMGQTNSSQCEYLHPEIEKIKSYLTMTGRLYARREATVKYSYAARKAVCAWACACPSQSMQKCAYISQKVCVSVKGDLS